jgi:hypothetical protein
MNKIYYRFETHSCQFLKLEVFPIDKATHTERIRVYLSFDRQLHVPAYFPKKHIEYVLIDDYTCYVPGSCLGETSEKEAWKVAQKCLDKDIKIEQKKVDKITKQYHRDIAHLACLKRQKQSSGGEVLIDGYE